METNKKKVLTLERKGDSCLKTRRKTKITGAVKFGDLVATS